MKVLLYFYFKTITIYNNFALSLSGSFIAIGQAMYLLYYNVVYSDQQSSQYNYGLEILRHLNFGQLFYSLLGYMSSLLQYGFFILAERVFQRYHKNPYIPFYVSCHQLVYSLLRLLYHLHNRLFLLIQYAKPICTIICIINCFLSIILFAQLIFVYLLHNFFPLTRLFRNYLFLNQVPFPIHITIFVSFFLSSNYHHNTYYNLR